MNELYEFDSRIKTQYGIVCGIDEAGRGPLAGDVYAGAVIIPEGVYIEGLNDSKKLTEKKREKLFEEITAKAKYGIGIATVAEIDEMNILNAAMLAMRRAYEDLGEKADIALIDGNRSPKMSIPEQLVVKGDATSAAIAAASIIAKVSRDRYMAEMAEKYPEWEFERHKGYGTKLHYEKITEFGESPIHRKTFLKKFYEKQQG